MIRVGIVNRETWDFLHHLHARLSERYQTTVFTPRESRSPVFRQRIARHLLERDLRLFMKSHDVVFFEWASEILALATRLPKTCSIVTRLHRYELYAWADRIAWEAVDRVILVSEAKRREFVRRFPAQADKTRVVPAGVSLSRFSLGTRVFSGSLGTLCHLTPRKRVYDLILTFSEMLHSVPSLHLFVGGDPHPDHMDYYEALLRLVDGLGLQSKVKFDGPVARPEEWYPKIDVFVSHSYSEGMQVAPMEAMASGCYTLSHDWDGAEELLPRDCLYVTGAELVAKTEAFCRLPDSEKGVQRSRMRMLATERFDADDINQRICEIVEGCVRSPSSRECQGR